MMMPINYTSAAMNPVEPNRLDGGRPASQLEVLQNRQRAKREFAEAMAMDASGTGNGLTTALHAVPHALGSVRHAIGRLFNNDDQRMGHEAA